MQLRRPPASYPPSTTTVSLTPAMPNPIHPLPLFHAPPPRPLILHSGPRPTSHTSPTSPPVTPSILHSNFVSAPTLRLLHRTLFTSLRAQDYPIFVSTLHHALQSLPPSSLPLPLLIPHLLTLARLHLWKDLLLLLNVLRQNGPPQTPDERLLVSLANLAVNESRYPLALHLIQCVTLAGFTLSNVGWSVLLKIHSRANNPGMVCRVVQDALDGRVRVDSVLLNSAVDALVRVGLVQKAWELVVDPAYASLLEACTFNILIKGFCAEGKLDTAFEVMRAMSTKGISPNDVTRNTLVAACAERGQLEGARELMADMMGGTKGRQHDIGMTALVGALAGNGKGEEAKNLVGEMGDSADDMTWAVLIGGLLKDGKLQEAWEAFEKGNGGETACVAMVGGLCASGNMQWVKRGAMVLLRRWQSDREVGVDLCNLVLKGFVRVGDVNRAHKFMRRMEVEGVSPDVVSFTIIMKGYTDARMYNKSKRIFREMSRKGITPDRVALGTFITTCVRSRNMQAAEKVLEYMERKGGVTSPGLHEYTPVIWGYMRDGLEMEVWKTYRRMREKKVVLSGYLVDMLSDFVVRLGKEILTKRTHHISMDDVAIAGVNLLRDGRADGVDGRVLRRCRRKMLRVVSETKAKRHFRGLDYPELQSASEKIFEKHGWNDIESGWRVF